MSDALEGKEYKFKPLEVTAKFAGLMAFGGMYWAYKISSVPLLAPVKAGYYATKGVLADNDVDKFENYAKSEKSLMQGSYIAKLALGSWYGDIGNHDSNNNAYAENDSGDMYE